MMHQWDDLPLPKRIWWPWDEGFPHAARTVVSFRRTFTVQADTTGAWCASTSNGYNAWLDDERIIESSDSRITWLTTHRREIPLSKGEHTLVVEAIDGISTLSYFMASLDWTEDSRRVRVATDANWEMSDWIWSPETNPIKQSLVTEAWQPAWAFDGVWAEPWGMPSNAPDDWCRLTTGWQEVTEEPLFLSRVVAVRQGLTRGGAQATTGGDGALTLTLPRPFPKSPPQLFARRPGPLWHVARQNVNAEINQWLELFEPRCPQVVLDAGAETFARVKVQLRSGGPAIVAITTGESLPEVDKYARRYSDVFVLRDGETYATAPHGFRYIKVMALSAGSDDATVVIEPVTVQHIRYPVERVGSFACSDPALDEIWRLSAETVHLCMQNEIWDGIKRDQLPWIGDLYTEALAVYHAFGDARLARRSLAVLGEIGPAPAPPLTEQRYPGLVAAWKVPGEGDINTIPSYTMWWVVGLHDYVQYTGDTSLIDELADSLVATLDHIAGWVGDDGLWAHQGGWHFIDWSPVSETERTTFCHLLATHALNLGAALLDSAGRDGGKYREAAARMTEAARREWWRGGAGSFGLSHHVNAMAIRSGILSYEEAQSLFLRTLTADPPLSMTYWHRYGDLDAARIVGDAAWGLAYIRTHWGRAVELGHTALWEAWDDAWRGPDPHAVSMIGDEHAQYGGYRTSLCHGWSAGPAVWLHTAILGVRPAAPGFAAMDFAPDLGDLSWAEGTIPTPHGPITVALRGAHNGDRATATLTAPAGVAVRVSAAVHSRWAVQINETGGD